MSHHIVEVRGLTHVYPDGTKALEDIGLRITHGESVAIVGSNQTAKDDGGIHRNRRDPALDAERIVKQIQIQHCLVAGGIRSNNGDRIIPWRQGINRTTPGAVDSDQLTDHSSSINCNFNNRTRLDGSPQNATSSGGCRIDGGQSERRRILVGVAAATTG